MPSEKVVQLRQRLAGRIPNLRILSEASPSREQSVWPTGVGQIDVLLHGGLPKGHLTELVTARNSSGSALFFATCLHKAAEKQQILALIDGQDSFDPAGFAPQTLSRLFWVRCRSAEQALKAVDLILRDRNLPLVVLDLQLNPASQLRRIPSSTWYRLQRILEGTSTVFMVLTPRAMVGCAQARLNLHSQFDLADVEKTGGELLQKLKMDLSHHRLHLGLPGQSVAKAS